MRILSPGHWGPLFPVSSVPSLFPVSTVGHPIKKHPDWQVSEKLESFLGKSGNKSSRHCLTCSRHIQPLSLKGSWRLRHKHETYFSFIQDLTWRELDRSFHSCSTYVWVLIWRLIFILRSSTWRSQPDSRTTDSLWAFDCISRSSWTEVVRGEGDDVTQYTQCLLLENTRLPSKDLYFVLL